jgi:hypothetical protein
MYKFIMVEGTCGGDYNIGACEGHANKMAQEGYEFVQCYQSSTRACLGQGKSVLVMVFKKR